MGELLGSVRGSQGPHCGTELIFGRAECQGLRKIIEGSAVSVGSPCFPEGRSLRIHSRIPWKLSTWGEVLPQSTQLGEGCKLDNQCPGS